MSVAAQVWDQFHRRGFWLFHDGCFIRDERSAAWGFVVLVRTGDPIGAIRRATAT
jgi:hypothetical protein